MIRTAAALVLSTLVVFAGMRAMASSAPFDTATSAWQRGDYITALNGYIQVLNAPGGDEYVERIALATGELFVTQELTADGRSGRFSPDGRFIAYETGLETSRRTIILRSDDAKAVIADLPGTSATFSPDGARVAYLKIIESDDVKNASQAIEHASLTAQNRNFLVQSLAWLIARDSTIVVRDIANGRETELATPGLLKTGLAYAADGRSLFFLGARQSDESRADIYAIRDDGAGAKLAVDAGGLKNVPIVDPAGEMLVYAIPSQSPLRRPPPPAPEGQRAEAGGQRAEGRGQRGGAEGGRTGGAAAGTAPAGQAGRGRGGQGNAPTTFGIVDLKTRSASIITGTAPTISADGKTLAYVAREGADFVLMAGPTISIQTPVKRTQLRMDAPALSPDGSRIAWQMMPRDDWEIFVADLDRTLRNERRVTREIQHDVLPRFISSDRLIAMMGEPRHRRSYLYDLAASGQPTRTRLFHNNTVRTIAPEYQWTANPDGSRLLVGSERDGDTVSPPRGVYLIDLTKKVSKADVLDRLRRNLKSETDLKAAGVRAFQPIAPEVRSVVTQVSVDRIFGYEKALFDFDSKNITRPGNRRAAEFLFDTYKSFGCEPEYQWFERANAFEGKTANVVATLRGTVNPELVYVISSHFDSVEAGPGADDDTSGTSALLEAARVLAHHPLPATVVFASMTGEEAGLLGSREFVRRAVEKKSQILGALNNDMIGWMNDERLDNTIRYSNPGIRDIQHAAAMQFTRLITYDALYWKGTDAMSFYDVYGDVIGGIGSYPVLGSPYYHQATDLLENENHELIAETAKTTIATIMLLASSPARLTKLTVDSFNGSTAALSWAPAPEKGITSYVVAFGPSSAPRQRRLVVTAPHVTLANVAPGTNVSVKAVNARGLQSWDWASIKLADVKKSVTSQDK